MNKYYQLTILKSVKQQAKIAMFYLIDILVIVGIGFGMFQLQGYLKLPIQYFILLFIVSTGFGIFLCIKPSSAGGSRNISIMLRLLNMDRQVYVTQSYSKGVKKQRGKN